MIKERIRKSFLVIPSPPFKEVSTQLLNIPIETITNICFQIKRFVFYFIIILFFFA